MKLQEREWEAGDSRSARLLVCTAAASFAGWIFVKSLGPFLALSARQRSLAELAIVILGGLLVAWLNWRALARPLRIGNMRLPRKARSSGLLSAAGLARVRGPKDRAAPPRTSAPRNTRGINLIDDLPGALARGELSLAVLPLDPAIRGGELALRATVAWRHPILGCIGEEELAGIAEAAGCHLHLRRFALECALDACRRLSLAGKRGGIRLRLATGLLRDPELLGLVRDYLADLDGAPVRLQLEVPVEAFHARLDHQRIDALRLAGAHPLVRHDFLAVS